MTAIDYYILHIELLNLYNSMFEYWLTISFAFILAVHFAAGKMSKYLFYLLLGIYSLASFILIFRFGNITRGIGKLLVEIDEANFEPPPYYFTDSSGVVVVVGMISLMLVGTVLAVVFAIRQNRASKNGT